MPEEGYHRDDVATVKFRTRLLWDAYDAHVKMQELVSLLVVKFQQPVPLGMRAPAQLVGAHVLTCPCVYVPMPPTPPLPLLPTRTSLMHPLAHPPQARVQKRREEAAADPDIVARAIADRQAEVDAEALEVGVGGVLPELWSPAACTAVDSWLFLASVWCPLACSMSSARAPASCAPASCAPARAPASCAPVACHMKCLSPLETNNEHHPLVSLAHLQKAKRDWGTLWDVKLRKLVNAVWQEYVDKEDACPKFISGNSM